MMQFVEDNGLESIISWELNGYGLQINNPDRLVEILPLFFGQTKYRSFRRQLNMWHFHRILEGPNKGIFIHPYFVKHDKSLCAQMSRQLSFKPDLLKEQEFMAIASSIEPDPIRETSLLNMQTMPQTSSQEQQNLLADHRSAPATDNSIYTDLCSIQRRERFEPVVKTTETDGFFQLSGNPVTSFSAFDRLPMLPSLPDSGNSGSSSFDAALKTIESIILSDQDSKNRPATTNLFSSACNPLQQDFHDGAFISFEGKNFFFLDDATP